MPIKNKRYLKKKKKKKGEISYNLEIEKKNK